METAAIPNNTVMSGTNGNNISVIMRIYEYENMRI